MARKVVLVRHATPGIDPVAPPSSWGLNEQGWRDAAALGQRLAGYGIQLVVTSAELKAIETGEAIASALGTMTSQNEGLGEQGLDRIPWIGDPGDFQAGVERHFSSPDLPLFGPESSAEAGDRFDNVVNGVQEDALVALVSHGRIMAAWLSRIGGRPAMEIWQDLRMPDALLVDVEAGTWSRIGDE